MLSKLVNSIGGRRRVYLDHASLTPVDPRVARAISRHASLRYANPSSLYAEGTAAKRALDASRRSTADFLGAHPDEVIFTSGGTEANSMALVGVAEAAQTKLGNGSARPHLIISSVEHSSIMETATELERRGVRVTRLPVDRSGHISLDGLEHAISPETFLVSIMTVNNETGALQPVREVAKVIRKARKRFGRAESRYPLFHTDAAQAALYHDLQVDRLGVDLLTLDGGKVHGPRGLGCLYVRRGTPIEAVMRGGGQERGLRPGTENIPAIAGFASALGIAASLRESETGRVAELKRTFIAGLKTMCGDVVVNGDPAEASPHILNVSIPGIDNELAVLRLDAAGIACSTKSSCLRDADESYVLKSMGADSRTAIRFSFGRTTTVGDIKRTLLAISRILC